MRGRLAPVSELDAPLRASMYALLRRHFDGVHAARFDADLSEKNWAVLVEDERGSLAGFSTILIRCDRWRGEPITVVYSGDTIVRPDAWGSPALPRTWVRGVRALHRAHGEGPIWWLLITSGFRTYRFLPVFCRRFFPRHDGAADVRLRDFADALARRHFGDAYDARAGVVRFSAPQVLRPGLDGIPGGRRTDPHVAFFERANPGHARGDELVSLASLEDENLTPAGLRMLYGSAPFRGGARTPAAGDPVVSSLAPVGTAGVRARAGEP